MFVFVTNKNDFPHADRYNGHDYVFQPGEKQMLAAEAAAHLFGFGREDKSENLVRLGWANRPNDEGVKWLSKFVFTEARVVEADGEATVREEAASTSMDSPMAQKRGPGRPPMARPAA